MAMFPTQKYSSGSLQTMPAQKMPQGGALGPVPMGKPMGGPSNQLTQMPMGGSMGGMGGEQFNKPMDGSMGVMGGPQFNQPQTPFSPTQGGSMGGMGGEQFNKPMGGPSNQLTQMPVGKPAIQPGMPVSTKPMQMPATVGIGGSNGNMNPQQRMMKQAATVNALRRF